MRTTSQANQLRPALIAAKGISPAAAKGSKTMPFPRAIHLSANSSGKDTHWSKGAPSWLHLQEGSISQTSPHEETLSATSSGIDHFVPENMKISV